MRKLHDGATMPAKQETLSPDQRAHAQEHAQMHHYSGSPGNASGRGYMTSPSAMFNAAMTHGFLHRPAVGTTGLMGAGTLCQPGLVNPLMLHSGATAFLQKVPSLI